MRGAGSEKDEIRQLLLSSMDSPSEGVRYCAVQWALRIFPLKDFSARYICILGSADHKAEVRESALKGLIIKREAGQATYIPKHCSLCFC